jgi:hypothetical protein
VTLTVKVRPGASGTCIFTVPPGSTFPSMLASVEFQRTMSSTRVSKAQILSGGDLISAETAHCIRNIERVFTAVMPSVVTRQSIDPRTSVDRRDAFGPWRNPHHEESRRPGSCCMERTYTFRPDAIHTLQRVQSVSNERVREFLQRGRGAKHNLHRLLACRDSRPTSAARRGLLLEFVC